MRTAGGWGLGIGGRGRGVKGFVLGAVGWRLEFGNWRVEMGDLGSGGAGGVSSMRMASGVLSEGKLSSIASSNPQFWQ
jgi:hypothetical protein